MKDATLSEKIIKFKSLLKEVIDIDKNIKTTNEGDVEKLQHLLHDIDTLNWTADTISLSENSGEVAVHIAGYVVKNWKKEWKCCSYYFIEEIVSDKNLDFSYTEILSRGDLTIPSMNFTNYDCVFLSCHIRVFRVNLHSAVDWMSRNSFLETGTTSEN